VADAVFESHSIASVTIAYNGAHVLRQHLRGLGAQSRRIDEIVVVDNASTDGTQSVLSEHPQVTTLRLSENLGIGGGLAAGLAYAATQKKHAWVWIFDQDSLPAPDALERLLGGLHDLQHDAEKIAILAPVCTNAQTGMAYPALKWGGYRFVPVCFSPDQPVAFADLVISSGSLMRNEAIQKAGLPRQDFFMDFVDYEHCLRLRSLGYLVAVVRDSKLDHAIGTPTVFRIFGRVKSWTDHAPWREYYMTRNEIVTMWRYYPSPLSKAFVLYRLARHAVAVLVFGKHKLACLEMMYRGLRDGRASRLGIRHGEAVKSGGSASGAMIAR
jgi:GT2 family glycosyltransferase